MRFWIPSHFLFSAFCIAYLPHSREKESQQVAAHDWPCWTLKLKKEEAWFIWYFRLLESQKHPRRRQYQVISVFKETVYGSPSSTWRRLPQKGREIVDFKWEKEILPEKKKQRACICKIAGCSGSKVMLQSYSTFVSCW